MANYEGTGRSNYVRVNNEEAFIKVVTHYGLLHKKDTDGKISVISQEEGGETNDFIFIDDEDQFDELKQLGLVSKDAEYDETVELPEFTSFICKFLVDGEIMIWQHAGHEANRYISGYSVAFNNKNERVGVSLDEIYKKATRKFKKEPTRVEY